MVTTYAHADANHQTPLGASATDVSAGSVACTAGTTSRSCTIALTTPAGNDDFAFVLYDAAPANGTIPSTARTFSAQRGVTQTIIAGSANVIAAAGISAVIVGLSGQAALCSARGRRDNAQHRLTIAPTDFGK